MAFITARSLAEAIGQLKGTADYMLKIWLCLKQMGMSDGKAVEIDTASPEWALKRLFGYGDPSGEFFVPFAHTVRFQTMKGDAARSVIQTNVKRWEASGSVVGVDPTEYLDIRSVNDKLLVKPGRNYPLGLGYGKKGFARSDSTRVAMPDMAFAAWYYRQEDLGDDVTRESLLDRLQTDLTLTPVEMELVFVPTAWLPETQATKLSDSELRKVVSTAKSEKDYPTDEMPETFEHYANRVRSRVTTLPGPRWLNVNPKESLRELFDSGAKAILLYGPPRTGKTHAIDELVPRTSEARATIQMHDGWTYSELMLGLKPDGEGWGYKDGPLLAAIRSGKTLIVIEEISRTDFVQAVGELFSLFETGYRGKDYALVLADGSELTVDPSVRFICTMNTLDKSTEDVDDALLGRFASVQFLTRVEDLDDMLQHLRIGDATRRSLLELYGTIIQYYPLGHAYFSSFEGDSNPVQYYLSRIRPVLYKHLSNYRDDDLATIDSKVDQLFPT
jgi:5-methylcytosine-specific restriction enzyme B